MVRKLLILRHADALSHAESHKDIDRELSHLGHSQAEKISDYIHNRFNVIDKGIVSSANRTKQTSSYIKNLSQIEYTNLLYEASLSQLLQIISAQDNDIETLIIIGHNPTLSLLASTLLVNEFINMPAAGLIELTYDLENWIEILEEKIPFSYEKIFLS